MRGRMDTPCHGSFLALMPDQGFRSPRRGWSQCPRLGQYHQWLLAPVLSWDLAVPRPWGDKPARWMGWQSSM